MKNKDGTVRNGILIHQGNYPKDSRGCLLIGKGIHFFGGIKGITHSKEAFKEFKKIADKHLGKKFNLIVTSKL